MAAQDDIGKQIGYYRNSGGFDIHIHERGITFKDGRPLHFDDLDPYMATRSTPSISNSEIQDVISELVAMISDTFLEEDEKLVLPEGYLDVLPSVEKFGYLKSLCSCPECSKFSICLHSGEINWSGRAMKIAEDDIERLLSLLHGYRAWVNDQALANHE